MNTVFTFLHDLLWGWPTILLLVFFGLYLSIRLRFFQILKPQLWLLETLRDLFSRKRSDSPSPLAALSTALAGSAGTGNIIGVAVAISAAGPGVIFWIWISSFFSMITVFAENILGSYYRIQKNGYWQGGAMYYLEYGLKSRFGAAFFAAACVLSSFAMGNMVQAGAIAGNAKEFGLSPVLCGAVLSLLVLGTICGGFKRISSIAQKLIPFAVGIYFLACFCILCLYREKLISSVLLIFNEAFSLKSTAVGTGTSLFLSFREGISKGIFTNEAGLGSSVMAHSCTEEKEPVKTGMWGIFQVFLDTSVMCTLTGLCLIVTDAYLLSGSFSMCTYAFSCLLGSFGKWFVMISCFLFAFAAISSWYVYGETSLLYLKPHAALFPYRLLFAAFSFLACTANFSRLWLLSDLCCGLMALPNMAALILLSEKIVLEMHRYQEKS